ncbi:MAG: SCP2 sterol-binding domain-containing protein [Gammaproteobacteria bacterium]|nr:SCP2 sterol-binding domain-containing protein [Gammaproteobacteria bacterium]MDH5593121.1 SCP2 sterol-binding domain-containing protein [Gammaproteobacteria bacterium]
MLDQIIASSFEKALKKYLQHDESIAGKLAKLEGKVISIENTLPPFTLFLFPSINGIQISTDYNAEPDAIIRGNPVSLTALMTSTKKSDVMFSQHASLHGDTVVGQEFSNILKQVDFDWEEELSHLTGDPVAHQIGRTVRALSDWGKDVMASSQMNVSEYLHEEIRLLPAREEINGFLAEIDQLRNDTDRLEQRITRLLKTGAAS